MTCTNIAPQIFIPLEQNFLVSQCSRPIIIFLFDNIKINETQFFVIMEGIWWYTIQLFVGRINLNLMYFGSNTLYLFERILHLNSSRLLTNVVDILNQTLVSHSLASYYHIFQWKLPKWLQIICGSVVFYETERIIFNHNVHKKDSKGL